VRADPSPGKPSEKGRRLALIALPLALLSFGGIRAEVRTDLRIIPFYLTGDFGGNSTTDLYFVPFITTARGSRNDFRVTVPFLSIESEELVAFIGGEVVPIGTGGSTTQSGLGDIVVRDDYFYFEGGGRRPWLYATVRMKLPTADETKGLGSGEFDYGPGAGFIQPVGSRLHLLGEAIYMVRGDPQGIDFRNTLWFFLGGEARLSESSRVSLFYDRRESVIPGNEANADLILGYSHRVSETFGLRSFVTVGLTDTAEDYGVGLGVVFREDRTKHRRRRATP
jgi:hypothetical protein